MFDEAAYEKARDDGKDMDTANRIAAGEVVEEKKKPKKDK